MVQKTFDFVNTVEEQGKELLQSKKKAITQQDKIFKFFADNWPMDFTPNEIHLTLFRDSDFDKITPLTSVRRGISQLTKAGHLIKTDKRRPGLYGKLTYSWTLNKEI